MPSGFRDPFFSASLLSITTQAEAPSENCVGVARRDVFSFFDFAAAAEHGLQRLQPLKRRVGSVALVAIDRVLDNGFGARCLVGLFHFRLQGNDLVLEFLCLLSCGRPALAFQRIFVLAFAGLTL